MKNWLYLVGYRYSLLLFLEALLSKDYQDNSSINYTHNRGDM